MKRINKKGLLNEIKKIVREKLSRKEDITSMWKELNDINNFYNEKKEETKLYETIKQMVKKELSENFNPSFTDSDEVPLYDNSEIIDKRTEIQKIFDGDYDDIICSVAAFHPRGPIKDAAQKRVKILGKESMY